MSSTSTTRYTRLRRDKYKSHRDRALFRAAFAVGFAVLFCSLFVVGQLFGTTTEIKSYTHDRELLEFSIVEKLDGAPGCTAESKLGYYGLPIWLAGTIFTFFGLAIVCDDFFIDSLERISLALNLSDDVAGATFMAAGSSAPELFTSLIGFFFAPDDNPGPGTIVGSAVFNITIIIGLSAVLAHETLKLNWWPLVRDSTFYSISIILLVLTFQLNPLPSKDADGKIQGEVHWYEGLVLVLAYFVYILLMKYNRNIIGLINNWKDRGVIREHEEMVQKGHDALSFDRFRGMNPLLRSVYRQGVDYESRMRMLEQSKADRRPAFKTVAKTVVLANRLKSMAGEGSVSELHKKDESVSIEMGHVSVDIPADQKAATVDASAHEDAADGKVAGAAGAADDAEMAVGEVEDSGGDSRPMWRKVVDGIVAVISFPWMMLFRFTIPNSADPKWAKWYPLTFIMSIVWIAAISFFMVDFARKAGNCMGIGPEVLGLTILAAGTSVPDALSSVLVARDGKGDMAVSNAIGSNVFDILLGLGIPWLIGTAIQGERAVDTSGITIYTIILFAVLIIFLVTMILTKFRLHKWIGYMLFVIYVAFVVFALLFDKYSKAG